MMTPNPTDRAHAISPLDVFAPPPHMSVQAAQPSPAFAAVLNRSPSTTKPAAYRHPAQQLLPERPERSQDKNSSDTTTVPVGKKPSAKAGRMEKSQRRTDDTRRNDEQAPSQTANMPASDASRTAPQQNEANAHGDPVAADGDGPQSVDPTSDPAPGDKTGIEQPLVAIAEIPVDVAVLQAEAEQPQTSDNSVTSDGEPQSAKRPATTPDYQASSGDAAVPTVANAAALDGNGPLSLVDADQNSPSAADPIVAMDRQLATQELQPTESSGNSGDNHKGSGEDAGLSQNATDVQTPVLPVPDSLTNPTAQNAATPPSAADAPAPPKDAPQPQSGSLQTTPGVPPAPNRLPQHVLTRSEGHHGHNPVPVPIDSARFLSRVAKAFTAAQQRDGEVRLRLSPPELGSLRLQVSVQDGVMVARMETETETAKAQLANNLPALRERLAEQGIRIERFDIDLMQRPSSGTPDRSSDPQQQPEPQPFRSLRTDQTNTEAPSQTAPGDNWNGKGRLNVII